MLNKMTRVFYYIVFLVVLVDFTSGIQPCFKDQDCSKDHMKCSLNGTGSHGGVCKCREGWVPWKWDCHPVVTLNQPCSTSTQCYVREGEAICSPISQQCSCDRLYLPQLVDILDLSQPPGRSLQPGRSQQPGRLFLPLTNHSQNRNIQNKSTKEWICALNKVYTSDDIIPIHKPDTPLSRPHRIPVHDAHRAIQHAVRQAVSSHHQAFISDSSLLFVLIILGILVSGIATIMYVRAAHDKRLSQAAVRSLITMMNENDRIDQIKRSNTTDSFKAGLYVEEKLGGVNHLNTRSSDESGSEQSTDISGSWQEDTHPTSIPDLTNSLPSRLTLVPLEGDDILRLPAPHMSRAALPPIKSSKSIDLLSSTHHLFKENGYEHQELSAAAPSTVVNMNQNFADSLQNSSLPCQGFENNFVDVIPTRSPGLDDLSTLSMHTPGLENLSTLSMHTLSFKNLNQISYQNLKEDLPKSVASFPGENIF